MQDTRERATRRATGRGHTQAPPEPQKPLWTYAPELEAFVVRAVTRPAPLQDMLILAWRGQWITAA